MNLCVLANVGQRDLSLSGQRIDPKELRAKTAELRDALKKDRDTTLGQLDAPILLPALNFLLDQLHPHDSQARVWLFGTSQDDPQFQQGDTADAAHLLAALLGARYTQSRLDKARVLTVSGPPNEYDSMLDAYAERLKSVQGQLQDADRIYVLLAGGTPACNTALLLNAARFYQDRVQAILVSEKSGQVVPLQIVQQVLQAHRTSQARKLAQRMDLAGVAELTDPSSPEGLLARHAAARVAFDLDSAWDLANRLATSPSPLRQLGLDLRKDLDRLRQKDPLARLQELWMHWDIAFARKDYLVGIQLLYRLLEAAARWKVETELGLDTDDPGRFQKGVDRLSTLAQYLDTAEHQGKALKWRGEEPNTVTLEHVLRYLQAGKPKADGTVLNPLQQKDLAECLGLWKRFWDIKQLRNKSLLNHGFDGVSEAKIKAAYAGDLNNDVRVFLQKLGASLPTENRFVRIRDELLKLLE